MSAAWLEYVKVFWPIIGGVGALLTLFGVLWLRTKFTPLEDHRLVGTKVAALETTSAAHEERLKALEGHANQAPTRLELQDDIAKLAERMAGMEAGLRGVGKELATHNSYLHSLIEQGLKGGGK